MVSGIVAGSRIRTPVTSSTHDAHGHQERISVNGTWDKVPSAHSSSRTPASFRARRWAGGDADIVWIHRTVCVTYPFRAVSSRGFRGNRVVARVLPCSGLMNDMSYADGAAS